LGLGIDLEKASDQDICDYNVLLIDMLDINGIAGDWVAEWFTLPYMQNNM